MGDIREKRDIREIWAELGLVVVAIFWGLGFVAAKFALEDLTAYDVMGYRYGGAFLVMLVLCAKHISKIDWATVKAGVLIGSVMFFGNMLQTYGLQYTTPGKQTFIICMYTVLVPILSWIFFREKIPRNMVIAACIAFSGIACLTLNENLTIGFGDALTFIFAISFSIHIILVGRFMKNMDALAFTLVQIGTCAFWSVSASFLLGDGMSFAALGSLGTPAMLGALQLVFLNTAFAFLLQNICQRIAPPHHTAILMSLETVFGALFAFLLTDEVFDQRMIFGCCLMFTAIVVSNINLDKLNE